MEPAQADSHNFNAETMAFYDFPGFPRRSPKSFDVIKPASASKIGAPLQLPAARTRACEAPFLRKICPVLRLGSHPYDTGLNSLTVYCS